MIQSAIYILPCQSYEYKNGPCQCEFFIGQEPMSCYDLPNGLHNVICLSEFYDTAKGRPCGKNSKMRKNRRRAPEAEKYVKFNILFAAAPGGEKRETKQRKTSDTLEERKKEREEERETHRQTDR